MTTAIVPSDEDLILSEVETGRLDVERAAAFLARCRDTDEVLEFLDRARAVEVYTRRRRASLAAQTDAAELALRAERRLGELCAEVTGGRGGDRRSSAAGELGPSLGDLGISKKESSRWQKLAAIEPEDFDAHVAAVREKGERLTTAGAIRAVSDASTYDGDEWYTPAKYLAAARLAMGGIDLDPASCAKAQETVQAGAFFTKDDDGLAREWFGRTWLNMPFSLGGAFVDKAIAEYREGRAQQLVILQNACTDTGWFHALLAAEAAVCFPKGRIPFLDPSGRPVSGNRSGQAFFYLGDNDGRVRFLDAFRDFGAVAERFLMPHPFRGGVS